MRKLLCFRPLLSHASCCARTLHHVAEYPAYRLHRWLLSKFLKPRVELKGMLRDAATTPETILPLPGSFALFLSSQLKQSPSRKVKPMSYLLASRSGAGGVDQSSPQPRGGADSCRDHNRRLEAIRRMPVNADYLDGPEPATAAALATRSAADRGRKGAR